MSAYSQHSRRRFARHHLVLPVVGVATAAAVFTGVAFATASETTLLPIGTPTATAVKPKPAPAPVAPVVPVKKYEFVGQYQWQTQQNFRPGAFTVASSDKKAFLTFQSDGNLAYYVHGKYVWGTNTYLEANRGASLRFFRDGRVRIYNKDNQLVWSQGQTKLVLPTQPRGLHTLSVNAYKPEVYEFSVKATDSTKTKSKLWQSPLLMTR